MKPSLQARGEWLRVKLNFLSSIYIGNVASQHSLVSHPFLSYTPIKERKETVAHEFCFARRRRRQCRKNDREESTYRAAAARSQRFRWWFSLAFCLQEIQLLVYGASMVIHGVDYW